ncbi:MAG: 2-dehydropantoate 2-reductase [Acidisphaera sp.]|nr:2-dehydropantoate 2-reductase [Acidisphaera sp.]
MRILVVGAGAIGGYFGGRLLQAGRDVTFLVRARRATELARTGLAIRSHLGDADLRAPVLSEEALAEPFDLVLLGCKAYDLDAAMISFARAVGPGTAILPVLNGMRHMDVLAERFGDGRVLGGQCVISAALDPEGRILHLNEAHTLTFGEPDGAQTPRIAAITAALSGAGFDAERSETILQAMWEKWVFIATLAGVTCLMRGAIGDVVAAGAGDLATALFDECAAIAAAQGFAPRPAFRKRMRPAFAAPGSPMTASMLRDVERGAPVEADHILGDLLGRAASPEDQPLLRIALAHLKSYEARRTRENAAGG